MSLRCELEKIDNWREVCLDKKDNIRPITDSLIFATMAVEMGEITEANAGEFYARVSLWTKYVGPFFRDGKGEPILIAGSDVVEHIGLSVNVITKTRHQWFARMVVPAMNEDVEHVNRLLAAGISGGR